MQIPFYFGIPLIARAASVRWSRVEELLALTLRSVGSQSDQNWRVLIAGHDMPGCLGEASGSDPRILFLPADWPATPPTMANDDAGRKKWVIAEYVRASGGGLLMYLDADDLVDSRCVATARESIVDHRTAGIVTAGVAIDYRSGNALVLPDPRLGGLAFHEVCGSSTVARLDPAASDPVRRDPHTALGSHHEWQQSAARAGLDLARLAVCGGYFVNTSESHSEQYGPFAEWRCEFARRVARLGSPLAPELAGQLGLDPGFLSRSDRSVAGLE